MDEAFTRSGAGLTSPDWTGIARLDQRRSADLAQLAGLDGDEWLVVAFDIGGGGQGHELRVAAVRRDALPEAADVLPGIAAENDGEIPVTEFLVHDVDPYEVLQTISSSFELRMRARGAKDLPLRVVDRREGPEQPLV